MSKDARAVLKADGTPKKAYGRVYVNRDRCKGCGFCIEFCPRKVLTRDKTLNRLGYHPPHIAKLDACRGCDLCGLFCPDLAIYGVCLDSIEDDDEG